MAKIAHFQLKHLVGFIGGEGYRYNTELLLGQKKIAGVDDYYADGSLYCDITWYGSLKDKKILKTTMEKIVNNADSDLLSCDTINHCVEYMVELLIELQDVEKQGKKYLSAYRPIQNVYIGIYSAWMASKKSDKLYIPCPGMINNKAITKEQAETLIKKKNGKPLGLVEMHMGKDLDLSLDEYIGIFKPYLNTQEPGMNGIDGTR